MIHSGGSGTIDTRHTKFRHEVLPVGVHGLKVIWSAGLARLLFSDPRDKPGEVFPRFDEQPRLQGLQTFESVDVLLNLCENICQRKTFRRASLVFSDAAPCLCHSAPFPDTPENCSAATKVTQMGRINQGLVGCSTRFVNA